MGGLTMLPLEEVLAIMFAKSCDNIIRFWKTELLTALTLYTLFLTVSTEELILDVLTILTRVVYKLFFRAELQV